MNIEQLHKHYLESKSVCTDTRKIENNCIFFALKGDNFNGNKFALEALKNGAKHVVIDEHEYNTDARCILVDDVLKTLQELANYHRKYLGLKIISLTGSNGKTTTKELINSVLSKRYNTVATIGNLNNHIGVPLTLLRMDTTTEIGIVEMGANHQKEIEFLCTIAEPDYGYITNFGKAHLEGFGGVEGVIKGKTELYTHLKNNQKLIFVNTKDQTQIKQVGEYSKIVQFGDTNSDITIINKGANPFVTVYYSNLTISSNLIGLYNFSNISTAIAMGNHFNVSNEDIKSAIEGYTPDNNRSQIINKNGNKILLDAYNANPTSMKAALDNLSNLEDENKIAILGDMFELGESAKQEHIEIAKYASNLNIENIYLVGGNFFDAQFESIYIKYFKTFEDLKPKIDFNKIKKSTILIKGSRGMALERLLEL